MKYKGRRKGKKAKKLGVEATIAISILFKPFREQRGRKSPPWYKEIKNVKNSERWGMKEDFLCCVAASFWLVYFVKKGLIAPG